MSRYSVKHGGAVAALGLALVLTAAGCGGPAASNGEQQSTEGPAPTASSESLVDAATEEGTLVWYTSNTRPTAEKYEAMFEAKYPGIDVQVFQAGGSQVISKVEAEIMAGGIQADFVDYSEGAVAVDQAERGLLERFKPEFADEAKDSLIDDENFYFTPSYLTSSIVYNTNLVSEADAPTSWEDLLDPKWAGKVAIASPDYAGTAVTTIGALQQTFGDEYINELGANGLLVMKGFGDVENAIVSGQIPVAITLSFRGISDQSSGKPVKYTVPEEGQIELVSSAAIIAGAKHPNAAKLFANFLMGDESMQLRADSFYFPARPGFASSTPALEQYADVKMISTDQDQMADPVYVAEVKDLFKKATT